MNSTRELSRIYDRSVAYLEGLREAGALDGSDDVSPFWREILADPKRCNHPTFSEMLVLRRGFTYPLGDRSKAGDGDADRDYARSAHAVVSCSMDPAVLATFDESPVGAPPVERFGDQALTGGGIVNALTTHRIEQALDRFALDRPLRVLEIGAGYGAVADQLLRRREVARYAICDLPENLLLSGYYVPANHPDRSVAFVAPGDAPTAALVFVAPPYLDALEGPFDLIVNSYSFQEMNRSSVERYLGFAARTLAEDGLLYSLNAHGKAGISAAGQYLVDGLRLRAAAPVRRFAWQVFGTHPYELLMAPGDGTADAARAQRLDRLGALRQLGLHDELAAQWTGLPEPVAPPEEPAAVRKLEAALTAFARGAADDEPLRQAGAALDAAHARVVTELARGVIAVERADLVALRARVAATAEIAPHLADEVSLLARDPDAVRALLASRVGLPPAPAKPVWQRQLGALRRHAALKRASWIGR